MEQVNKRKGNTLMMSFIMVQRYCFKNFQGMLNFYF